MDGALCLTALIMYKFFISAPSASCSPSLLERLSPDANSVRVLDRETLEETCAERGAKENMRESAQPFTFGVGIP